MNTLVYDRSFEGLLTIIFEVYERKLNDVVIYREGEANSSLFGDSQIITSQPEKAKRVYTKLKERLSAVACGQFYKAYLSGLTGIENHLLNYVKYILSAKAAVESNYSQPDVLMIQQTSRKVDREKHRMEAFVRFQLTKDRLYYAIIQPDFNVLPLISKHFSD